MEEAKDFCQARGASLLNLTSLEQSQDLQEWWENRGREGHCGRQAPALWLGIQRLANDKWGDITANVEAEFSQWYSTEPNNHKGREDCAMVITDPLLAKKAQTANFGWMDVPCDTRQFPFHQNFEISLWTMCQREVDPNQVATKALESSPEDPVVESANGCLPGYTNLGTGCYMFSNQPGTADEGKETCRRTGGYLVEVNNKEEWDVLGKEWELVKKRAESCPTDHPFFWLGVSDFAEEGTWRLGRFSEEVEFSRAEEGDRVRMAAASSWHRRMVVLLGHVGDRGEPKDRMVVGWDGRRSRGEVEVGRQQGEHLLLVRLVQLQSEEREPLLVRRGRLRDSNSQAKLLRPVPGADC